MYVMSSLPKSQQSIASGLFQTLTRLSLTIGMAATTAIFNSVEAMPDDDRGGYHAGDPIRPYSATFWFAFGAAAVSLPLVLGLKIKTQGNRRKKEDVEVPHQEDTTT
jgi:hypothetical protein